MSSKISVWLFDFDGTLSDPEHRRHHVAQKPKNWPAFSRECVNDPPIPQVVYLFKSLFAAPDTEVFVLSGRESKMKNGSVQWLLNQAGLPENYRADLYSRLYMRPHSDYRGDEIIKKELLEKVIERLNDAHGEDGYELMGIFDDRPKVVRMWQQNNLFTFDVGQGRGEF